jgi:predicted kinase
VAPPSTLECVILIGLPGSGKTTFYHQQFALTHRHLSNDLWPTVSARRARLQRELQDALRAGQSVVIDNVNATAADRAFVISLARSHGARVVGYYFAVTTRQAVARNAGRTGRARVANVAIFAAAKRFEMPRREEGFDELSIIEG